jgi:putative acetyltransferase
LIRDFKASDSQALSDLIRLTMQRSNSLDYPLERLQLLIDYFSPAKIARLGNERRCLVAELEDRIVGTVALEDTKLRTFFVHPDYQSRGIGSRLLKGIERIGQRTGLTRLGTEASLTGASFYERHGYCRTGKVLDGVAGIQIEVEKKLEPSTVQIDL